MGQAWDCLKVAKKFCISIAILFVSAVGMAQQGSQPDSSDMPASAAPTVAKVPLSNDAIARELAEMKARIAQLEAELKESKEASDAVTADKDANALRAAEAATTSGVTSSSTTGITHDSAAPGTATAPEISSQITTKGEPFPGDWTWLNSNGRVKDSPMSTKYLDRKS